MTTTLLSGIAFGAALTASGVHQPSVILGQLKLADWDMMETFLTATASSTLLILAFHTANIVKLAPRCYSPLGLFAHYDGNLIGGALLGVGMALARSCPGTVLAQVGAGLPSGFPALVGALLGGLGFTSLVRPWLRANAACKPPKSEITENEREPSRTVHESLGINRYVVAGTFEAVLVAIVAGLTLFSSASRGGFAATRPIAGGLLIGLAQLVSLLLRRSAVGVSTAFEEAGDFVWWPFYSPGESESQRPKGMSVVFAGGIVGGAWLVSQAMPITPLFQPSESESAIPIIVAAVPLWQSVLGGFVMVMGARIAGGCTSGHGITGMSLLSVSSFLTIGSALGAGVLTAKMFL
ncbi:hypothetical protein B0H67DRAFT_478457 [Lasiosphaeris hirsuta]|uniref:Sulphur transport domain-containing protein n=1 Tax=Lasiosphaeris hirsuta TaxID=260670 RepID=A0AA40BCV3_9PEZI|nr:hypothetical protein B0H67DRAFT_478457 [Lasiosphaeris hirsuta]